MKIFENKIHYKKVIILYISKGKRNQITLLKLTLVVLVYASSNIYLYIYCLLYYLLNV